MTQPLDFNELMRTAERQIEECDAKLKQHEAHLRSVMPAAPLERRNRQRYAEIGRAVVARLEERNRGATAASDRLRAEIQRIAEAHTGDKRLTAKLILQEVSLERIGRTALPTERTVQWHQKQLRLSADIHAKRKA